MDSWWIWGISGRFVMGRMRMILVLVLVGAGDNGLNIIGSGVCCSDSGRQVRIRIDRTCLHIVKSGSCDMIY